MTGDNAARLKQRSLKLAETKPTNEHLVNIRKALDLLRSERRRLIADVVDPSLDPANITNRLTELVSLQARIYALNEAEDDERKVRPKA